MELVPLTGAQQQAIGALVNQGRLGVVPADLVRARTFMQQASDAIADMPHLTKPQNRFNLAYDACHDIGEAMLAAFGYRTLSSSGQHESIGRFLRIVVENPPGEEDAWRFDRLRRSRNQQRYAARPVGESEASLAAQTAGGLFAAAVQRGLPH